MTGEPFFERVIKERVTFGAKDGGKNHSIVIQAIMQPCSPVALLAARIIRQFSSSRPELEPVVQRGERESVWVYPFAFQGFSEVEQAGDPTRYKPAG